MSKKLRVFAVMLLTLALSAVAAFAESASGTANDAVTSAVQSVSADMLATGNAVIPIALTVIGLALVVSFGVRMFKKFAKP